MDGWINTGYKDIFPVAYFYNLIKTLDPNCLMISNGTSGANIYSEIDTYDGVTPAADNTRRAEWGHLVRVISPTWFYHSGDNQTSAAWKTAADVNAEIQYAIARNCTTAIDIQPNEAGVLSAPQAALLGHLHV
ncbi:hypothetical protein CCP3SC15_1610014 [Gammaproteobacteria bacterium]